MPTTFTTPKELSRQVSALGRVVLAQADALKHIDAQFDAAIAQGEDPTALKTRMDAQMAGVQAALESVGEELGSTTDVSGGGSLPFACVKRWQSGSPPGLKHFVLGYTTNYMYDSVTNQRQGKRIILYNDAASVANIWDGLAAGDVISVSGANPSSNDGNYTLKYAVDAKGDNATYGLENGDFGASTGWTEGSDWSIGSGIAAYSASSGNSTLTNALSGMTSGAVYTIQFDLAYTSGAGSLKVDLGGGYYWIADISDSTAAGTQVLITNVVSTTPTLTFTATWTSGTFAISVDNVYVYGTPGVLIEETLVSTVTDENAIITLEQTAA